MRENRPYGSEGGEAKAFPTPIGPMDGADSELPCNLDTGDPCRYDGILGCWLMVAKPLNLA